MTVTYTAEVATCKRFGCFLTLLVKWKGSVYKLIWMDLIVFLGIYYALNFTYRLLLNESQKHAFESLVLYCRNYASIIPLSFVLGFYVAIVMQRWWEQYITIPWPDPVAVFVSCFVHGLDERGRVMRRTVMRYVCLCLTMALTNISPRVKLRFPTLDHLVEAGLLLENEKLIFEKMDISFPKHPKHWMPIVWAASIITRARKEGRIRDDFSVKTIIDELNIFRGKCGVLMCYDLISVPLVYTQVVTLAVYSYFLCSVVGQQWINAEIAPGYHNEVDCYFPIFTTLHFFFYMGWLKVAETLINPFGEDDDDFEVNWMIDRNLQVSYLIVDEMHQMHPELVKDQYWDEVFPNELPYANEQDAGRDPPEPSTAKLNLSRRTSRSLTGVKTVQSVLPQSMPSSAVELGQPSYINRLGSALRRLRIHEQMENSSSSRESSVSLIEDKRHAKVITFAAPPLPSGATGSQTPDDATPPQKTPPPSPRNQQPEASSTPKAMSLEQLASTMRSPSASASASQSAVTAAPATDTAMGISSEPASAAADSDEADEFESLRQQRQQERAQRLQKEYLRTVEKVNLRRPDKSGADSSTPGKPARSKDRPEQSSDDDNLTENEENKWEDSTLESESQTETPNRHKKS